jgi:hypothetical protein
VSPHLHKERTREIILPQQSRNVIASFQAVDIPFQRLVIASIIKVSFSHNAKVSTPFGINLLRFRRSKDARTNLGRLISEVINPHFRRIRRRPHDVGRTLGGRVGWEQRTHALLIRKGIGIVVNVVIKGFRGSGGSNVKDENAVVAGHLKHTPVLDCRPVREPSQEDDTAVVNVLERWKRRDGCSNSEPKGDRLVSVEEECSGGKHKAEKAEEQCSFAPIRGCFAAALRQDFPTLYVHLSCLAAVCLSFFLCGLGAGLENFVLDRTIKIRGGRPPREAVGFYCYDLICLTTVVPRLEYFSRSLRDQDQDPRLKI